MFELISYFIVWDGRFKKLFFVKNNIYYWSFIIAASLILLSTAIHKFKETELSFIFYSKVFLDFVTILIYYPYILYKLIIYNQNFKKGKIYNNLLLNSEDNYYLLSSYLENNLISNILNFSLNIFGASFIIIGWTSNILNIILLNKLEYKLLFYTIPGLIDLVLFSLITVVFFFTQFYHLYNKHSQKYLVKNIEDYKF